MITLENIRIIFKLFLNDSSNVEKLKIILNDCISESSTNLQKIGDVAYIDNHFLDSEMHVLCKCNFGFLESGDFFEYLQLLKLKFKLLNINFAIGIEKFLNNYTSFEICNTNICVQNFGWGTYYYPEIFYDHYNVDERWSNQYNDYNIKFKKFFNIKYQNIKLIYANFYHDIHKLNVFFSIPPCNKDSQFKQTENTISKLTLDYRNINRVAISDIILSKKLKNYYIVTFNFWLFNPIKIETYQEISESFDEKIKKYWKWNQVRTFCDDDNIIEVIHESSIFYLTLELSKNEMVNIIERFCTLISRNLEFVCWKKINLSITSLVKKPLDDKILKKKLLKNGSFELSYLIETILSMGLLTKVDLLISQEKRDTFIENVLSCYQENNKITLLALENIIKRIERMFFVKNICKMFQLIYKNESENEYLVDDFIEEDIDQNIFYVRKVIVTPTRTLFKIPTAMIGNRVMRQYDPTGEKMLKVIFRTDNLRSTKEIGSDCILTEIINKYLDKGIIVGGFIYNFLGASNSQIRDGGCYFFRGSKYDMISIREGLGSIKQEAIPKMMGRLGQCFTQSFLAKNAIIANDKYVKDNDYFTPVWKDSGEKEYCFSDGCGMISNEMGRKIVSSFKNIFNQSSTCYQFRFRGYKGVLVKYSTLDKVNQMAIDKKISIKNIGRINNDNLWTNDFSVDCVFRYSQCKFRGLLKDCQLEIVKSSKPQELSLNRPLINVLDQVSKLQSYECNKRICYRINELFEKHISSIISIFLHEKNAYETLSNMSLKYFGIRKLNNHKLISFHKEIFFKNILKNYAIYQIKDNLKKLKIKIPTNLGRLMFGVIDETGSLEYGQVFIQYSLNINSSSKKTKNKDDKKVHLGKVMITKSPTIVAGDVRIFEAVDVNLLHDLVDVIVFPRDGPFPHTTEMAGSDLDGDEYSVIFDEELFFEYNMKPFDFDVGTSTNEVVNGIKDHKDFDDRMKEFMLTYLTSDNVGVLASSHLIQSDFFGINSEVCKRIAIKHNIAIDFQKTGKFPQPLTKEWENDIPPEVPSVVAEFFDGNISKMPSYKSSRLISQLYNRLNKLETLLESSDLLLQDEEYTKNPLISINGWEKYNDLAMKYYIKYSTAIINLMDTFEIHDESELFCGYRINSNYNNINDITNRLSYQNINFLIQKKLTLIIYKIKTEILETFCPLEHFYDVIPDINDYENIKRILENPLSNYPKELEEFVVAGYNILYDSTKKDIIKIYSFPWIFWDVLKKIAFINYYNNCNIISLSYPTFHDLLTKYIMEWYLSINEKDKVLKKLVTEDEELKICLEYIKCYKNLNILLTFLLSWSKLNNLNIKIKEDKLSDLSEEEIKNSFDINSSIGGIGKHFLNILFILSSFKFMKLDHIYGWEMDMECGYFLLQEHCYLIHQAAEKTINSLVFYHAFDILPQFKNKCNNLQDCKSYHSMYVYLPKNMKCHESYIFDRVKNISGLEALKYRKENYYFNGCKETTLWIVTPVGTYDAYLKFKQFIKVDVSTSFIISEKHNFPYVLGLKLYEKIINRPVVMS
ncbi:RNA-dependent RNA polymerase, eukaryotic-type family-containing protein [Strongyloides ratti]|uniref:RNA-dependent RNA polymerase, eukaryotic-type family-containing protein n=1 Tax=Strongyloides ratti TaxID=34506 RepID=A0A090KZ76_STRRB|nr:RNA-dependent RNA polymerase, eukaryotic-type family-containing protein [Strongyloides ratti]CEF62701.1 RNA-dependent RNA polymerase, eukaryotic-type family-containing protein [Strongyloides ratti]